MRYFIIEQSVVPIISTKFGIVQEIDGVKISKFKVVQQVSNKTQRSNFLLVQEIEQDVATINYKRIRN